MPNSGPPTQSSIVALTEEVNSLRKTYQTNKRHTQILYSCIIVLVISLIWSFKISTDARDAIAVNKASQVTNCQNANKTRASQILLWDFILNVSSNSSPEASDPARTALREDLRVWIHDLFAERDCSDLTKKYKTPVPPDVKKYLDAINKHRPK